MRSMANRTLKLMILAMSLAAITLYIPSSFADIPSVTSRPVPVSAMQRDKCEDMIIDSYCESSGVATIINLESYSLANKVTVEKGCVKIVRDKNISTKRNYAAAKDIVIE